MLSLARSSRWSTRVISRARHGTDQRGDPSGRLANFNGADVCDPCTVAGRSGTIVLPFSGTVDPSGFVSGRFSIGHGTGDLANLHGVGTFQSSTGVGGPFSGVYHFDPNSAGAARRTAVPWSTLRTA